MQRSDVVLAAGRASGATVVAQGPRCRPVAAVVLIVHVPAVAAVLAVEPHVRAEQRGRHRAGGDDERLDDERPKDEREDERDEDRLDRLLDAARARRGAGAGGGVGVRFLPPICRCCPAPRPSHSLRDMVTSGCRRG